MEELSVQPETGAGTDPAALPLFHTDGASGRAGGPRQGRRRSSFSLAGVTPLRSVDSTENSVAARPTDVGQRPSANDWRDSESLDWSLIARMRQEVADRLSQESAGALLEDREAQHDRGWELIGELLTRESNERARAGQEVWGPAEQSRISRAVFDAVFGLGRLQPLVDDDEVENVMIFGHDRVALGLTGGRQVPGPKVAESDEELIEFLAFVATRSEVNPRPFSPSHPRLDLRLDDGSRLAAQAWVCPVPQVVIRRHRMTRVSLEEMVERQALTALAASFLAAAIRSGMSVVVSGGQSAGKTTMIRALCGQIPKPEVIATFETEYELHLHEMPDRHPYAFAYEARPGSGEIGPDGKRAGEVTLADLLFSSFRMNLDRQIVGEVRGPEAMAMLKAMQSGSGSISTTHAANAVGAIEKLVTCVMEAGAHATHSFAVRAVAAGINIIAHVTKEVEPLENGEARVHRYISEIVAVSPGEEQRGYATTHIFRAAPGERVARPVVLPDELRSLERFGFDLTAFVREAGEIQ